jgi:hypothetical protein
VCKTRVDALSYRNFKSRVDAPGTSELILLDSEVKYRLKGNRIKACVVWRCMM